MQIYHSTSIIRAEAVRLFHIFQECSQYPTQILSIQSLNKFIAQQNLLPEKDPVAIMHSLDKQGKQMNKDYWGECVSRYLIDVQTRTLMDIGDLHIHFRNLLQGSYERPILRFQQWDENRGLSDNERNQKHRIILNYEKQLSLFIHNMDTNVLANSIQKINFCLSLITLGFNFRRETIRIYEFILKGNFIEVIRYCLTINISSHQFLVAILKCLCYLLTALKYQPIRKLLMPTFICKVDNLKGLMQNMSDNRIQIKYYTFVLVCMGAHHLSEFSDLIILNRPCLQYVSGSIQSLSETDGLIYGLEVLVSVVQAFLRQDQGWKDLEKDIIQSIFMFGMSALKNENIKEWDTQVACLRLLSVCVKFEQLSEQSIGTLNVLNNIFLRHEDKKRNQELAPLVSGALNIIRNLLIFRKLDIKSAIINDKNFQSYFRQSLKLDHQPWYQQANILHLAIIFSSEDYSLIQPIFRLSLSKDGCTKLILSETLINLLKSSNSNQWMLTFMYQKNILDCLGNLFGESFRDDQVLTYHYGNENLIFFTHKQVFINCLRALYLLTDDRSKSQSYSFLKKCEFYKKSFSEYFIDKITTAFELFFSSNNLTFLKFNLNEKYEIDLFEKQKIKGFKLMSIVIEEMTRHLRKRYVKLQILKKVHHLRNFFLDNIYKIIPIAQLESENIPIYLKFRVIVDREPTKVEQLYRLSWSHLQSYLMEVIKKMCGFQPQRFKIQNIAQRSELKSQYDYRRCLDQVLSNYEKSRFQVQIRIFDIMEKKQTDFRPGSFNLEGSPSRRITPIIEGSRSRSFRIPKHRDISPYGQRRNMGSNSFTDNRSNSPTFGSQCRRCGKITYNPQKLCNNCQNNHNNRFT